MKWGWNGWVIVTVSKDEVLIPAVVDCLGLVGQDHPSFDLLFCRFVVEALYDGKNESADLREQMAVMPKIRSQELGEGLCEVKIEGLRG